jgi:hypothetical protein
VLKLRLYYVVLRLADLSKYVVYPSTLANLTLIMLFLKLLNFKNYFFQIKNIVKENNEYLGIFHLLK